MGKRKRIDDVQFVTAFANATTLDDVEKATGMTRAAIQTKATKLRKAGVLLPRFVKAARPVETDKLNDILRKAGKLAAPATKRKVAKGK